VTYTVKEIFPTLQGEGFHTGRPSVFIRFAGCNLWTGLEKDRAQATCKFCDTDFVGTDGPGGGKFHDAADLATTAKKIWNETHAKKQKEAAPFVVLTGGEPLLQIDSALIDVLHGFGFKIAIETNGTKPVLPGIDWVCVSPKAGANLEQRTGNELKIVYPQTGIDPADYETLEFDHFFLQPMDGDEQEKSTEAVRSYCTKHPKWKVSLQTHKLLGIP